MDLSIKGNDKATVKEIMAHLNGALRALDEQGDPRLNGAREKIQEARVWLAFSCGGSAVIEGSLPGLCGT